MPRPTLPPTPAASTDIPGKADVGVAHDPSWALPPAALSDGSRGSVSSSSVVSSNASDFSYHPSSPAPSRQPTALAAQGSPSNSRKRTANGADDDDDYSLPPPPTRLRKIIQMKPKEEKSHAQEQEAQPTDKTASGGSAPKGKGGRGKKQNNGSTAAGRKVARKTAHSLIERRRRSKMNEEFGVLKDMIPACTGQEMHKLAILQASIEYMRYLEDCVSELKVANRAKHAPGSPSQQKTLETTIAMEDMEDSADEGDEDMSDAVSPIAATTPNAQAAQSLNDTSPTIYPAERRGFSALSSPAISAADGCPRRLSEYTTSPNIFGLSSGPHFGAFSIHSNTTSPSILPSPSVAGQSDGQSRDRSFALTSPALEPQPDTREDHEAMAALLMLNNDRRKWNSVESTTGSRGMSVKDLLSG